MPNLPTITPAEIVTVAGAVLLLHVAPFVFTTVEDYRRRKLERRNAVPAEPFLATDSLTYPSPEAPAQVTTDLPPLEETVDKCEDVLREPQHERPQSPSDKGLSAHPEIVEGYFQRESTDSPEVVVPAAVPADSTETAEQSTARHSGYEPPAVTPFQANNGHQFRLEDLHWVRLGDWPSADVRDDPARRQLWAEAERLLEQHRGVLLSSVLVSPFPVRSACLGGIKQDGSTSCLHFLLFPNLWPASPDQAVARAVFEIDAANGEIRGRVEILQASA